jgi:primosomal protein N''
MSTNPDRIVNLLSNWLGGRLATDALRREIEEIGTADLAPGPAQAVQELQQELAQAENGERGHLEMVARETLEEVALG